MTAFRGAPIIVPMKILISGQGPLAHGILDFLEQLEWIEITAVIGAARSSLVKRGVEFGAKSFRPGRVQRAAADIFLAIEDPADHHHPWSESTRLGGLHVHTSLLPKHRGCDPVRWAILEGDTHVGNTIHYITAEAWQGNVLAQEQKEVKDDEDATSMEQLLHDEARAMLVKVLHALAKIGPLPGTPQSDEGASHHETSPDPAGANLDWSAPMAEVHRRIQAFCNPHGGAKAVLESSPLAVWRAQPLLPEPPPKGSPEMVTAQNFKGAKTAGAVLHGPENRVAVRCGCGGALELLELQRDPESGYHPVKEVASLLADATQLQSAC